MRTMKIIVDVYHPADVNFYKNAINIFEKRGIEVELTVRPRGELISILQKEEIQNHPRTLS